MKLYIVTQNVIPDYDTYDSFVVAATDENVARMCHPDGRKEWDGKNETYGSWCDTKDVQVQEIGECTLTFEANEKSRIILASFNAG